VSSTSPEGTSPPERDPGATPSTEGSATTGPDVPVGDAPGTPDAPGAPGAPHAPGTPDDPDDLAGFSSPMTRLLSTARTWLAALVALALVVPAGAWLVDELDFRRSADAVVATLEGDRAGAEAAGTVLLVRAVGCDGRSSSGTAFVVETAAGPALLTNRHVVEAARTVGVRALDGDTSLRVTGVRLSSSADVAVLEVDDPGALPPAVALGRDAGGAGDAVRLVGFPAATPFTAAGRIVEVAADRLLLEIEVAPGASGSPVVAEDGLVVGQVHAVTADGLGVATPAGRLAPAIEDARPSPAC
jgi:S1-C subfamily serine protease